ncbi:hypothetical protein [Faecalibacter sp. LW9]|uniref:hypothetical protein n=1 Tax=Faecalibacter sp. LW9 TaxID=3103144 RepID=UPI002B003094|nr:hypothetical protein [Faecalibacter sp. LW9]
MLVSFTNCSVLKKNKESEKSSQKTEYQEDTTYNEETSSSTSESSFVRKSDISQWFNYTYEPMFDQFGQLIPFTIEQTINGQTEKISITGASVTGAQNKSFHQSEEKRETETTYKSIITYKTDTTYKTKTTYVTKTKERFAFGPQSVYPILMFGLIILFAILAFTGHWSWIIGVYKKITKYLIR